MLAEFRRETFSPHVGDPFLVKIDDGRTLDLELIEVNALGGDPVGSPAPGVRMPFSIVWRGPNTPILPQRIYRMAHGTLGVFDLFLVPIGPDDGGMRYEAVFT